VPLAIIVEDVAKVKQAVMSRALFVKNLLQKRRTDLPDGTPQLISITLVPT